MKTTDFSKTITSGHLSETLEKQFGARVNLNKYNREELEDLRNKFRTKLSQHEAVANFNDLLTNETYQKDRAILQLLNTRIKEMLGEDIKKLRDKMDELSEAKKGTRPPKTKIAAKGSKPDFLDMDKDGNKKEPMKKAIADKKVAEASHQEKTTMKHVKNPTAGEKKAAKDIKPGVAGYADRVAMLKSAEKDGRLKNEDAPAVGTKKKTSSGGEVTKTATGSVHKAGKKGYGNKWDGETQDQAPAKASKSAKSSAEKKAAKANDIKLPAWKGNVTKHSSNHGADRDDGTGDEVKEALKGKQGKLDVDKDGKLEKSDFAALRAKKKVKESSDAFKHNVRFVNESINYLLNEDEEGKAKAITAAGDMVNDFTSWMQRVGQYQTKTMIELADAIKADFGAAESEAFKQAVGPALTATLDVLTQQRETVSNAVAVLAGEAVPEEPMGMDPEADMMPSPEMDVSAPDEMNPEPTDDEFGASDAASGMGTSGREMRESKFARKLAESHSIMSKLSK
jgi:hypothetical protein